VKTKHTDTAGSRGATSRKEEKKRKEKKKPKRRERRGRKEDKIERGGKEEGFTMLQKRTKQTVCIMGT
jgi:hypothetical protein